MVLWRVVAVLYVALLLTIKRHGVRAMMPDFSISGDPAVTVGNTDSNSWTVQVSYGYSGPSEADGASFQVIVLDYETCTTQISSSPVLPSPDASTAVAIDAGAALFQANMIVDIDHAEATPLVWTPVDNTQGVLQYCVRIELYYQNELVNFARTAISITVSVLNGHLSTFSESLGIVQSAPVTSTTSSVELEFMIAVFACDTFSNPLSEPIPTITPGRPIRVCANLAATDADTGNENHHGAHVERFGSVAYRSDDTAVPATTVVADGVPMSGLANVDCTQVAGVCRIEFLPMASYFMDGAASLDIEGDVIVALGRRRRTSVGSTLTKRQEQQESTPFSFRVQLTSNPKGRYGLVPQPVTTKEEWSTPLRTSFNDFFCFQGSLSSASSPRLLSTAGKLSFFYLLSTSLAILLLL